MASAAPRAAAARPRRVRALCRALYDWAPPPDWRPRSRWMVWLLGSTLFWFSLVATAVTLLGGNLGATLQQAEPVRTWLAQGALPAGTPWIREHFAALFVPLLVLGALTRFGITLLGPLRYERDCGEPLPLPYLATLMITNTVLFALPAAVLVAMGLAALALGFGYEEGRALFESAAGAVSGAIERFVPTLVTVPYPWPLLFAMATGGLGYYWWHRLQHVWRPLWLLSHRSHHAMTHLVQPASLPAANPLAFLANAIPQALLVGTITKLFAAEPMLLESMLFVLVSHTFTEVFNHTEPVYRWTMAGPLRRFWFTFWGCGAWHQVHHSSLPEHRMVNLGGGPWMLWDRVFGSYVEPPEAKPPMGLTGRPPLRATPLRLALSGHLELLRELASNRCWRDRTRILLGPSSYQPPRAAHDLIEPNAATTAPR